MCCIKSRRLRHGMCCIKSRHLSGWARLKRQQINKGAVPKGNIPMPDTSHDSIQVPKGDTLLRDII